MPDLTPRMGYEIPTLAEADNVPAWLMAIITNVEESVVPVVDTVITRDAEHGSDPAGSIVVTTAPLAVWIKESAVGWDCIWSKPVWNLVTLLNDWTNTSHQVGWAKIGDVIYWKGVLGVPAGYDPDTWITICTVDGDATPVGGTQWFGVSGAPVPARMRIQSGQLLGRLPSGADGAQLSVPTPYVSVSAG